MLDWNALPRPIIALSPMADMTDSAFCRVAKRFSAPVVFREMVSSEAIVRGNDRSVEMGRFDEVERPIVQQLFGADPAVMAEATRIIDELYAPDAFDINMGCPVYKITSNFNGAALMKDPGRAAAIVRAMTSATDRPVSVKLRLGWSDPTEVIEVAKVVADAGAALITVHGRTKEQGYSGKADWAAVGRAKAAVSVPVLCNGDVHEAETAPEALAVSGADGLLIARGALGNPWIFRQIDDVLSGLPAARPTMTERVAVVRDHAHLHAEQYGGNAPLVTFRKHLVWYFKGIPGAKTFRERMVRVSTVAELDAVLDDLLADAAVRDGRMGRVASAA